VAFGCRSAFAVFFVAVLEEFGWSRGVTAGALLVAGATWMISGPLIGMLLDRFGPRLVFPAGALVFALGFVVTSTTETVARFYVGMGVLAAMGFGALPMTAQAVVISNWFVRRRGTAMGIVASGVGIGILGVVPLAQVLIGALGWRQACLALAALLAGVLVPLNVVFQRHRPEDIGLVPDSRAAPAAGPRPRGDGGWTLARALRTARFWALALGMFAGAIPLHMILVHQVAAAVDAGFPKVLAASALGLTGFFTSPSMILWGAGSDRIGREWAYTLGSLAMIVGIGLLLFAEYPARAWMLYVFTVFFALGFASRQSLYPTIAADLFHGPHFGAINGVLALFVGAGSGVGPWLGGYLFDLWGSYAVAFALAVALALVSVVLIWTACARGVPNVLRE